MDVLFCEPSLVDDDVITLLKYVESMVKTASRDLPVFKYVEERGSVSHHRSTRDDDRQMRTG